MIYIITAAAIIVIIAAFNKKPSAKPTTKPSVYLPEEDEEVQKMIDRYYDWM